MTASHSPHCPSHPVFSSDFTPLEPSILTFVSPTVLRDWEGAPLLAWQLTHPACTLPVQSAKLQEVFIICQGDSLPAVGFDLLNTCKRFPDWNTWSSEQAAPAKLQAASQEAPECPTVPLIPPSLLFRGKWRGLGQTLHEPRFTVVCTQTVKEVGTHLHPSALTDTVLMSNYGVLIM